MKMLAAAAGIVICLLLIADAARADVGLERADRHAGRPGAEVRLTVACGFCYPPCRGPKGERHPEGFERGICMLGTKRRPPASFGISLLPRERAERLLACAIAGGDCPTPTRPPRRGGYRYLGEAEPPPGGNNPESGDLPRYLLSFRIPPLPPGDYSYVIWCGACIDGPAGSLVVNPMAPLWRLAVRPPD